MPPIESPKRAAGRRLKPGRAKGRGRPRATSYETCSGSDNDDGGPNGGSAKDAPVSQVPSAIRTIRTLKQPRASNSAKPTSFCDTPLKEARAQSTNKLRDAWEGIFERYSRGDHLASGRDDIYDFETGEVWHDAGFLDDMLDDGDDEVAQLGENASSNEISIGFFGLPGAMGQDDDSLESDTDDDSPEDDKPRSCSRIDDFEMPSDASSEDELGQWVGDILPPVSQEYKQAKRAKSELAEDLRQFLSLDKSESRALVELEALKRESLHPAASKPRLLKEESVRPISRSSPNPLIRQASTSFRHSPCPFGLKPTLRVSSSARSSPFPSPMYSYSPVSRSPFSISASKPSSAGSSTSYSTTGHGITANVKLDGGNAILPQAMANDDSSDDDCTLVSENLSSHDVFGSGLNIIRSTSLANAAATLKREKPVELAHDARVVSLYTSHPPLLPENMRNDSYNDRSVYSANHTNNLARIAQSTDLKIKRKTVIEVVIPRRSVSVSELSRTRYQPSLGPTPARPSHALKQKATTHDVFSSIPRINRNDTVPRRPSPLKISTQASSYHWPTPPPSIDDGQTEPFASTSFVPAQPEKANSIADSVSEAEDTAIVPSNMAVTPPKPPLSPLSKQTRLRPTISRFLTPSSEVHLSSPSVMPYRVASSRPAVESVQHERQPWQFSLKPSHTTTKPTTWSDVGLPTPPPSQASTSSKSASPERAILKAPHYRIPGHLSHTASRLEEEAREIFKSPKKVTVEKRPVHPSPGKRKRRSVTPDVDDYTGDTDDELMFTRPPESMKSILLDSTPSRPTEATPVATVSAPHHRPRIRCDSVVRSRSVSVSPYVRRAGSVFVKRPTVAPPDNSGDESDDPLGM
ncbi:hypothetical protein EMMF5_004915 [Cystobasidiomycetes sp. EMM_F5]